MYMSLAKDFARVTGTMRRAAVNIVGFMMVFVIIMFAFVSMMQVSETGRQGDRKTGRQGDRETGRQRDRETGRQRERESTTRVFSFSVVIHSYLGTKKYQLVDNLHTDT